MEKSPSVPLPGARDAGAIGSNKQAVVIGSNASERDMHQYARGIGEGWAVMCKCWGYAAICKQVGGMGRDVQVAETCCNMQAGGNQW